MADNNDQSSTEGNAAVSDSGSRITSSVFNMGHDSWFSSTAWPKINGLPTYFYLIFAFIILGCWGFLTHQRLIALHEVNLEHNVFLRLVGLVGIGTFTAFAVVWIDQLDRVTRLTRWWNVGNRPNDPSWSDVLRMVLGEDGVDPICYEKSLRPPSTMRGIKLTLAYLVLFCIMVAMITIILEDDALPLFRTYFDDGSAVSNSANLIMSFSQNLTAFLALLAAVTSIWFTHKQLQAKVKADSRQAWIDKLRGNIARFIALCDEHKAMHDSKSKSPTRKLTKCRIEMELMLNPSEKDHRLLMYLSIKLECFKFGQDKFAKIQDVINFENAIKADEKSSGADWNKITAPIPDRLHDNFDSEYSRLIGYAIRLSHVVLKREWELVKATR